MVRERRLSSLAKVVDHDGMLRPKPASREPVDLERTAAPMVSESPPDEGEAPSRDPLAEVVAGFSAGYIVGHRALSEDVRFPKVESARDEALEELFLEPAIGMEVVPDGPIDAKKDAEPIAQDGVNRARGVVGRRVPIAPEDGRPRSLERFEHVADLVAAVGLTGLSVEMEGDRRHPMAGKYDLDRERGLASEPLLPTGHLVLSVLERDDPGGLEGIPAQDGVSVEPDLVLAPDVVFAARAFGEIEVAGREREMKAQLLREDARHVAVSRARHSDVGFREKQEVRGPEIGMLPEGFELPFELDSSLEIPGDDTIAVFGVGFAPRVASGDGAPQHEAKLRLEVAIERKREELRGGTAPGKGIEVGLQLRPYEIVAHGFLMVPYRLRMRRLALLFSGAALPLPPVAQLPESGRELYEIACVQCHGKDGRGVDPSLVGFSVPLPDFTDCRFASRETADDWIAVTHSGGPARGFDSTMPSYAEALDAERIEKVVEFLRGFCKDRAWPQGELNLPLPLVTEKAFPEDEALWMTAIDLEGEVGATELVYERRVGARHQWEAALPIAASPEGGIGDIGLGWKTALWHTTNFILTAGGEVFFPTGDEETGLGTGTVVVEPYLGFARVLPGEWFLQAQGGAEVPADSAKAERELFWRGVIGRTFGAGGGLGRQWSPMLELLGSAVFDFEETSWSLLPQMQVSLSTRQHVRVNAGVEIPVNRNDERATRFVFYFLWDWFDGGLLDGW